MSTSPLPRLSEDNLTELAEHLLLACLASIPRDQINPVKYWDWAQKALQVASSRGTTYDRFVSEMHGQLPIPGAFRAKSTRWISLVGQTLEEADSYAAFRRIVRRNAPYIVVLARVRKEAEKEKWELDFGETEVQQSLAVSEAKEEVEA